MFVLVRDFIATKIAAVQSSTTQNTKILDDLTFSNKHFVETSRLVTDPVAISYPASRATSIFPGRRLCSQGTISGSLNQLATESITSSRASAKISPVGGFPLDSLAKSGFP